MRFHHLLILYNPISGRGLAATLAQRFHDQLKVLGAHIDCRPSQPHYNHKDPSWILPPESAIICLGGDGTLAGIIPLAVRANAPVYMVPLGNESLFARAFGMDRSLSTLMRALDTSPITEMQLPQVEQRYFTSMVSVGLDAEVVGEIARTRRGPIGHIGYVLPALRVIKRYHSAAITLEVDGKRALDSQRGFLIIGRTAQYARQLRLVPEAHAAKPTLAARFYPFTHSWHYLRWLPALCFGQAVSTAGSILIQGCSFEIKTSTQAAVQADGDYVGTTPVKIELTGDRLKILGAPCL